MDDMFAIEKAYGEILRKYRSFYRKSPLSVSSQARIGNVSEVLTESIFPPIPSPLSESEEEVYSLNCPYNIHDLIRKNETNIEYVYEGLIKTYPTSSLKRGFVEFCEENLEGELSSIEIGGERVIDKMYQSPNNKAIVVFTFPFRKTFSTDENGNAERNYSNEEKFVRKMIDRLYAFGYGFSSIGEVHGENYYNGVPEGVSLWRIQFEAKYDKDNILNRENIISKLPKKLFHIVPVRYMKKVIRNGLVPYSKSDRFDYPPRVYLFSKPIADEILRYGKQKVSSMDRYFHFNALEDKGAFIISVDRDKILNSDLFKNGKLVFYLDPCFVKNGSAIGDSIAIFTYGNIPPYMIDDECRNALFGYRDDGQIEVKSIGRSFLSHIRLD